MRWSQTMGKLILLSAYHILIWIEVCFKCRSTWNGVWLCTIQIMRFDCHVHRNQHKANLIITLKINQHRKHLNVVKTMSKTKNACMPCQSIIFAIVRVFIFCFQFTIERANEIFIRHFTIFIFHLIQIWLTFPILVKIFWHYFRNIFPSKGGLLIRRTYTFF